MNCTEAIGGKRFLVADLEKECYTGYHLTFLSIAVVCAFAYCLGIPLLVGFVIRFKTPCVCRNDDVGASDSEREDEKQQRAVSWWYDDAEDADLCYGPVSILQLKTWMDCGQFDSTTLVRNGEHGNDVPLLTALVATGAVQENATWFSGSDGDDTLQGPYTLAVLHLWLTNGDVNGDLMVRRGRLGDPLPLNTAAGDGAGANNGDESADDSMDAQDVPKKKRTRLRLRCQTRTSEDFVTRSVRQRFGFLFAGYDTIAHCLLFSSLYDITWVIKDDKFVVHIMFLISCIDKYTHIFNGRITD